jgi:Holliday junction resolvase RusA-like endonuclease
MVKKTPKNIKLAFNLIFDLPPTDNHLYGQKGKIRFMYSEAKDWKEIAQIQAKQLWKNKPLITNLTGEIKFYLKRDRDVMGSCKLIFDSFQKILYENDNQFNEIKLYKKVDKKNPRVEIFIYEEIKK